MKALNEIRSLIDQIIQWVKWGIGILLTVALAALVLRYFGVAVPYVPAGSEVVLAYLAGTYWLSR